MVIAHYDQDDTQLNETLHLVEKYNVECSAYKLNIPNETEVQAMTTDVIEKFKSIDILINNSGIGTVGNLIDSPYSQIDAVLDVNLRGSFANNSIISSVKRTS